MVTPADYYLLEIVEVEAGNADGVLGNASGEVLGVGSVGTSAALDRRLGVEGLSRRVSVVLVGWAQEARNAEAT